MEQKKPSLGDDRYRFHTSRCSVVLLSTETEAPGFQIARSELYRIYWYPLYAYKSLGDRSAKKGNVLTRGFFSRMIEDKTSRTRRSVHAFASFEPLRSTCWRTSRFPQRFCPASLARECCSDPSDDPVNSHSRDRDNRGMQVDLAARETCICPVCGTKFQASRDSQFCPACMLRRALDAGVEFETSEDILKPPAQHLVQRFDHYELMMDEHGRPLELGRGAMGVTYKAFDINLGCAVTLKLITERHLRDEAARLRFLREARTAASIRHSNVASVFHLGKTGEHYFYAMEFVEGETLQSLIKRLGRLEVTVALEIVTQVASGLAAVHKQKLVHRDIKPSNIMVRLEDEGAWIVKIIDLGLAKILTEATSESMLSIPGTFAGTPEFASPEQCAGIAIDIRSDLYSLGATLWQMVTGHPLFVGTAADIIYQHQHTPLSLGQLGALSQPVVALLEVLLEKDPKLRFQSPAELLRAMPIVRGAIAEGSTVTHQSLRHMPAGHAEAVSRNLTKSRRPEKISLAKLPITGGDIFGREGDIAFLDHAWANRDVNVVTIVAWAGVGKSTLVNQWVATNGGSTIPLRGVGFWLVFL